MTDLERTAIEALTAGDNVVSLKETNGTQHQRRLVLNIEKLSDYIAKNKGHKKDVFWEHFEEWVKNNTNECNSLATRYMCDFIKEHENTKSIKQLVDYHLIAFKKWGITVNTDLVSVINTKKRTWDEDNAVRSQENKKKKSTQYVNVKEYLPRMVSYLGNSPPDVFRDHVRTARMIKDKVFTKTALIEANTVANLDDAVIKILFLKVRAFLLMAKVTGLRWITFMRMTRSNVTWRDGSLLVEYRKKHNSKAIFSYVAIVPSIVATECPILAYSHFITSVPEYEHPFGFSHGTLNSKARARVAALLDLVAWAVGSECGIGYKKVHAMRSFCSSLLAERSVGTIERHEHLGWSTSTVESENYLDGAIPALTSRVPMVAAGRTNGEPPPSFWELLDTHGDVWENIALLSVAAKVSPINFTRSAPDTFTIKVQTHMIDASKRTVKTPEQIAIENRELHKENLELKRIVQLYKNRLGDSSDIEETRAEAEKRVTGVITELAKHSTDDTFPRQCLVAYNTVIAPTLTVHIGCGFLIKLNTGLGKTYQAMLILAARQLKDPIGLKTLFDESTSKSWVGWVRANRATIAVLNEVPMTSSVDYKNYLNS